MGRRGRLLISMLVAATLAAAGLPLGAGAPAAAVGCNPAWFDGGTGTLTDPFLVATAAQLAAIDDDDACATMAFVQTADIDLSGVPSWTPLFPTDSVRFGGVYYGGCHLIDNLKIRADKTSSAGNNQGLFGYARRATFRNMRVTNIDLEGHDAVTGIAPQMVDVNATEILVTGTILAKWTTGLIGGYAFSGSGSRLEGHGTVTATMQSSGGLYSYGPPNVSESWTDATVSALAPAAGLDTGGLVGYAQDPGTYENVYATGSVTGGNGSSYLGGLVGNMSSMTIRHSYATGAVTMPGGARIGGLVGGSYGPMTYDDAYWDSDTTGLATTSSGAGGATTTVGAKSTGDMKLSGTYSTWDPAIWNINSGSYPTLKWFDDGGLTNCPVVTTVAPGTAASGATVTITGKGFTGATAVAFGGVPATGVTVVSSTQITATVPAGTGTVNVSVTPAGVAVKTDVSGTWTSGTLTVPLAVKVGGFTYAGGGGGGGGGGSEPAPVSTPTPTPTPSPTAAPRAPSLDPINNPDNRNVPANGVSRGGSLLLVGGVPMPVTVTPDRRTDPTGLDVTGGAWSMRLVGLGGNSDPLGLGDQASLILQSQQVRVRSKVVAPVARANGRGFKPGSAVRFYILPSTYMGELVTDASGSFAGDVPVPAGIAPGSYTLQMNGLAPDGVVRSLSLGVVVRAAAAPVRTVRTSAKVFFPVMSAELDPAGRARLRALAKRSGTDATRVVSIGYVQDAGPSANDRTLSRQRAQAVASYLRSLGVRGKYVVRGDGVGGTSAAARKVVVRITSIR